MKYFTILFSVIAACFCLTSCSPDNSKNAETHSGSKLIKTVPEGAEIIYNNKVIGKTPYNLRAKPKFYTVKIAKKGFKDLYCSFDIKNGKNPDETYTLSPLTSSLLITSTPANADIISENKKIGETPFVMTDLKLGEYNFTLQKNGYSNKTFSVNIQSDRPVKYTANLEKNIGSIEINSEPANAAVFLNDKQIGVTPFKGEFTTGSYELTVKAQNYEEYKSLIHIEKNKTSQKNCKLTLLPGALQITSSPAGAKVLIDGKFIGQTPVTAIGLQAGTSCQVVVSNENFATETRNIKINPGKTEPVNFLLKRNKGDINFVVNQPGVTVYLNGEKFWTSNKNTTDPQQFTAKDMPPGTYTVKYYHYRAKPSSRAKKIELHAGETVNVEKMDLWIPNAEIHYKDDTIERVILIKQDFNSIYIEPEKGIRFTIPASQVKSIKELKD